MAIYHSSTNPNTESRTGTYTVTVSDTSTNALPGTRSYTYTCTPAYSVPNTCPCTSGKYGIQPIGERPDTGHEPPAGKHERGGVSGE